MEQKITGRTITFFIAMFDLWDAYLEGDEAGIIPGGGISLRTSGFGCDICTYTLYTNGKYEIQVWVSEKGEEGDWEIVKLGNIFEEVNV